MHDALGRNYQQVAYVSGLPGVAAALDARPFLFAGLAAGGPSRHRIAVPHGRPIPIWGSWGDPAMPRGASTTLGARYTDKHSWSTSELDVDWQGVTLYSFYLARWAGSAPARRLAAVPASPRRTAIHHEVPPPHVYLLRRAADPGVGGARRF
jgi:hypothetical protein